MRCKPAGSSRMFSGSAVAISGGMGQGSGISRMPWRKCRRMRLEHNQSRRKIRETAPPCVANNAFEWLQFVRLNAAGGCLRFATILQMPLPPQLELGEPNITSHWKSTILLLACGWMRGKCPNSGKKTVLKFVFINPVSMVGWSFLLSERFWFWSVPGGLYAYQINYDNISLTVVTGCFACWIVEQK